MAASQNRSFTDYIPQDNPLYAIPVQQGDVFNLSIAVTPNRQGILGWYDPTANEMRCAVVPVLEDCFTDDVVEAGDVITVWSSGSRTVYTGVIWIWGGNLYAFVSSYQGSNGRVECYIADDVEAPTSFTLVGTAKSHTAPSTPVITSVREGGIPTVTDGGRWLLPFHSWLTYAASALADCLGIFYSDNSGVTWSNPVARRKTPILSGTAGPQTTTIGWEPATDDYWMGSVIGPTFEWLPYSTTNDGTSWAENGQNTGVLYDPHFYIDNGTTLYAGLIEGGALQLYEVDDPTDPTTWTDLNMRGIVSGPHDEDDGFQIIPLAWPTTTNLLGVAFTAHDRIAYAPNCIPVHPDPLFIPYKARLNHLVADFTDEGIARAIDQQGQNLRAIEVWAHEWMTLVDSPDRCRLFIPYKDHAREPWDISVAQSFENWKAIERWAFQILSGECGCSCASATPPRDGCLLFIPHKNGLADLTDPTDLALLSRVAEWEFDNFKTLERWAGLYASGDCGCTV